MSAAIKQYTMGRHLTAVTITPQAVDGSGNLTDTTPVANLVTGQCRSVRLNRTKYTENVMAVNDTNENHVKTYTGYTIEVEELIPLAGSDLATAFDGHDYFKVHWTAGGDDVVAYCTVGSFSMGVTGQGSQSATISFLPINTSGSSPLVVS